jgi:hypothetical protein
VDKFNNTLVDNWVRVGEAGREKKGKEADGAFHAYLTTKLHTKLYTLLCTKNL